MLGCSTWEREQEMTPYVVALEEVDERVVLTNVEKSSKIELLEETKKPGEKVEEEILSHILLRRSI